MDPEAPPTTTAGNEQTSTGEVDSATSLAYETSKGIKERFSGWFRKAQDQITKLIEKRPDLSSVGVKAEQFGGQVANATEWAKSTLRTGVTGLGEVKDSALQSAGAQVERTLEAVSNNKVVRFLKGAAESYLNKFDPRGKEIKFWGGGIIVGIGSAVAVAEFGATVGFSPVVRSLTVAAILNASDAIYYKLHRHYVSGALDKTSFQSETNRREVLKRIFELERSVAGKGLKGEEFRKEYDSGLMEILKDQALYYPNSLIPQHKEVSQTIKDKLIKYGTDYAVVTSTARSLSAGLAAGSVVGALGELGLRVASPSLGTVGESIGERFGAGESAVAPQISPAEEDFLKMPPLPETIVTENQEKITALMESPQFLEEKAATVGKFLGATEQLTEAALKAQNISLSEIDAASFDKGIEAAQQTMEAKINEIADNSVRSVLSANPDASLDDINPVLEKAYQEWLSSESGQAQIQEAVQKGVADQLQVENDLLENMTGELEGKPDLFREVTVKPGDTMGHLLNLTWTNADAPKMGAHILANWDTLTGEWAQTASSYPAFLPDHPFPVSPSEISDLVDKALAGDEEAIKRLRRAIHWIPKGAQLRILTEDGIDKVLGSTAKLKIAA